MPHQRYGRSLYLQSARLDERGGGAFGYHQLCLQRPRPAQQMIRRRPGAYPRSSEIRTNLVQFSIARIPKHLMATRIKPHAAPLKDCDCHDHRTKLGERLIAASWAGDRKSNIGFFHCAICSLSECIGTKCRRCSCWPIQDTLHPSQAANVFVGIRRLNWTVGRM